MSCIRSSWASACRWPTRLAAFAFKQTLQVAHVDGLTFEFLRDLARDLAQKNEVAIVGAGPKGNLPLVTREAGTAYRAFLHGEVDGTDRYKFLLLLSDQELKLPDRAGRGERAVILETPVDRFSNLASS